MMSLRRILLLAGLAVCGTAALVAAAGQDPYIGYVYPAGGQQGTTFQVTVGGQRLANANEVYISGTGVRASVAGYVGAGGPLTRLQQDELRRQLEEIRAKRLGPQFTPKRAANKPQAAPAAPGATPPAAANAPPVALPDLPELRNLDQQTPAQLRRLADKFLNFGKRPKPSIAEQVTLEVTVDANAAPGDRELRLRTPAGLTNPLVFQVGQIPEARGGGKDEDASDLTAIQPPVVLNGQIMPGEVDRFPLQLRGGQKLVIAVQARKLIPYLADAVPGWFQAAVALRDSSGKEIAYANECGFAVDPALVFPVPQDGQYTLEIRDALYRGREDFVYRVDIGDESLVKTLFPLGSRGGIPIGASNTQLCFEMAQAHFGLENNPLPWSSEVEPNDTGQTSMHVTLPCIIGGRISKPGDKDVFRIDGHAGDQIVAEVYARRMGSALDSLLRLIDTSGKVVAWNDDCEDPTEGLFTHQADSYLSAKLPANGAYYVQLSDAERHGAEYAYYLRISRPQPDFALRVTPSCLNVPAGRAIMATAYAVRKDGWDGDIEIALKDAPAGFALSGAVIPKGRDRVRMTLTAPRGRTDQPIVLQLEGHAQIGGKTVTRPVIAAENMMQAFAYQHLVPSGQLMVMVTRNMGVSPRLDMAGGGRLAIPAGGSAQISFTLRPMPSAAIKLELSEPPAGVTLQDTSVTGSGYTLTLKADDKHVGYADNLIVEAFTEANAKRNGVASAQKQRVSLGVLPAIPFEIVQR